MKKYSSFIHGIALGVFLYQSVVDSVYAVPNSAESVVSENAPVAKKTVHQKKSALAKTKVEKTANKFVHPIGIFHHYNNKVKKEVLGLFYQVYNSKFIRVIRNSGSAISNNVVIENVIYTAKEYKMLYIDSGQWKEVALDLSFLFINNFANGFAKRHKGIFSGSTDINKLTKENAKEEVSRINKKSPTPEKSWQIVEEVAKSGKVKNEKKEEFLVNLANIQQAMDDVLEIDTKYHGVKAQLKDMQASLGSDKGREVETKRLEDYVKKIEAERLRDKIEIERLRDNIEDLSLSKDSSFDFAKELKNSEPKKIAQEMLKSRESRTQTLGGLQAVQTISDLPSGNYLGNLRLPIYQLENQSFIYDLRSPFSTDDGKWGIRMPFQNRGWNEFFSFQGLRPQGIFSPVEGAQFFPQNRYTHYYIYGDLENKMDNIKEVTWHYTFPYALARHAGFWISVIQDIVIDELKPLLFPYRQTKAYADFHRNRAKVDSTKESLIWRNRLQGSIIITSQLILGGLQNLSYKPKYARFAANFFGEDSYIKRGIAPECSNWIINKFVMKLEHSYQGYGMGRLVSNAIISTIIEKGLPLLLGFAADVVSNIISRNLLIEIDKEQEHHDVPMFVKQQLVIAYINGATHQSIQDLMRKYSITNDQIISWYQQALFNGIATLK